MNEIVARLDCENVIEAPFRASKDIVDTFASVSVEVPTEAARSPMDAVLTDVMTMFAQAGSR